jgi:protocatechuate 4,5-dioxygenase beta chain
MTWYPNKTEELAAAAARAAASSGASLGPVYAKDGVSA